MLDFDWLDDWFPDVSHVSTSLLRFEWSMDAVGAGYWQVIVIVRDVGIGAGLCRRLVTTWQDILLFLLLHLNRKEYSVKYIW